MESDEADIFDYYYDPDENGNPDFDRPIPVTKEQYIRDYLYNVGDDPDELADLYLDFCDVGGDIEFLVFKDHLSSAVLIFRSASKSIRELDAKLKEQLKEASRSARFAEDTIQFEEAIGVIDDAYRVSIGATIVTAAAALETLLADLMPEMNPRPRGLQKLMQAFLKQHTVEAVRATEILELTQKVTKRRNTFAHTLTGSYFDRDPSVTAMFTPESMEDTLYAVGRIAVLMDQIRGASSPSQRT